MLVISKKAIVIPVLMAIFAVAGLPGIAAAANVVEIFYLPHPPAEAVVRDVEDILRRYGQFTVNKYSFEDPQSRQLVSQHNLREHVPVVIFINGKNEFVIKGRKVIFKNFPKGNAFVPMFEGNWSYKEFEGILQTMARGK
jgi:hypothetical protein